MEKVHVPLGERAYDVLIGQGLLSQSGALIGPLLQRSRVAIITDERVGGLHLDTLISGLATAGITASQMS